MKKNDSKVVYTFIVAVITALAIIAGIYVGMSEIFVNSKYGFIMVIFIAATAAVCTIVGLHDKALFKDYSDRYNLIKKENDNYKEYIIELTRQRDNYKNDLEHFTSDEFNSEYTALKSKANALENFRNSFPMYLTDDHVVYAIIRTELVVGKFSTWHIIGALGNELWDCCILRSDTQTYKEMQNLISVTKNYNDIATLNLGNAILWE